LDEMDNPELAGQACEKVLRLCRDFLVC